MKLEPNICRFDGCDKKATARGYCGTHYYKLRREGKLDISQPVQRWVHCLSDIDPEARTATCRTCGPGIRINSRGNGKWRCYPDVRERSKKWKRARREQIRAEQMDSACEICGATEQLCWDHDHALEEAVYRGTLCMPCNFGIGNFRDDPALLRNAAKYVVSKRRTKESVTR